MVSVKLEIIVQKWSKHLFLFALLTRLGCQWSGLRREPQQHNLPSIFIKMKLVICVFVVVVAARACFVVTRDGVSQLCALLVQRVSCVWRVAQVSRGCIFYCFFASSSSHVLLLFSMLSSWEIWGMNMPNLPKVSCLEDLLVVVFVALALRQLTLLWRWLSSQDEYRRDTHNVLTTPLSRSLVRPPCGFTTALLIALGGRLSRERFGASQWWCRLRPSWSVMASIVPIAIGNGVVASCCLSRLCLVPMLASFSQLGFLIV